MTRKKHRTYMDYQIGRLNAVGLSLATISDLMGCHPSTVTNRLKSMELKPLDSRRSFMEDIIKNMPDPQQEWLIEHLEIQDMNISEYIRDLLDQEFLEQGEENHDTE